MDNTIGQYYKVATSENDGKMHIYSLQSREWEEAYKKSKEEHTEFPSGFVGQKLMEHSWIGNNFTDAVSWHIYKNPMRLAWVGDYANDTDWKYEGEYDGEETAQTIHQKTWDIREEDEEFIPRTKGKFDYSGKILVNHTKKIRVDLDQYIIDSTRDDWCIYPVSLLTAIGNGQGGGDYRCGSCPDGFQVGNWAWDVISIEDKLALEDVAFWEY